MTNLCKFLGRKLREITSSHHYAQLDLLRRSLDVCQSVNYGSKLNKASLLIAFQELASADHTLILYVAAQNAGLLIQRQEK